jgi:hypothetical protein
MKKENIIIIKIKYLILAFLKFHPIFLKIIYVVIAYRKALELNKKTIHKKIMIAEIFSIIELSLPNQFVVTNNIAT